MYLMSENKDPQTKFIYKTPILTMDLTASMDPQSYAPKRTIRFYLPYNELAFKLAYNRDITDDEYSVDDIVNDLRETIREIEPNIINITFGLIKNNTPYNLQSRLIQRELIPIIKNKQIISITESNEEINLK